MHGIEIGDYYLIKYQSEIIKGVVFKFFGTENYFVVTDKGRKYDVNYYDFISKIPDSEMSPKIKEIIQKVKRIDRIEQELIKANKELDTTLESLRYNNEILSVEKFEKCIRENISKKVKYSLKTPHKYTLKFIFLDDCVYIVISTSRVVCSDLSKVSYDFIENYGTGYFVKSTNSPMYLKIREKEDKDSLKFRDVKHSFVRFMTNETKLDVEFGTNTLCYYSGCTLALTALPFIEDNALEVAKIVNKLVNV